MGWQTYSLVWYQVPSGSWTLRSHSHYAPGKREVVYMCDCQSMKSYINKQTLLFQAFSSLHSLRYPKRPSGSYIHFNSIHNLSKQARLTYILSSTSSSCSSPYVMPCWHFSLSQQPVSLPWVVKGTKQLTIGVAPITASDQALQVASPVERGLVWTPRSLDTRQDRNRGGRDQDRNRNNNNNNRRIIIAQPINIRLTQIQIIKEVQIINVIQNLIVVNGLERARDTIRRNHFRNRNRGRNVVCTVSSPYQTVTNTFRTLSSSSSPWSSMLATVVVKTSVTSLDR